MKQNNLSENLYLLRKGRGLSQEAFAERIHISRQAVSKWERGEAYPDTENLIEIAAFYGITLDELVHASNISACVREGHGAEDASHETYEPDEIREAQQDGEAKEHGGITVRGHLHIDWDDIYPLFITVVYLLLGFLTPRGWAVGWTLYVTVPVASSILDCVRTRCVSAFAYPVFVTFIYLFVGMCFYVWHPTWLLFVTIPIFYSIAGIIDRVGRHR